LLPQHIRNRLRGARDPYACFSLVRCEIDPSLYPALAAWIPNLAQKNLPFVEGRFPSTNQSLRRQGRIFQPLGHANEVLWAGVVLRAHAARISSFCEASRRFDKSLLLGNYERAYSDLNEIEKLVGRSLWLIEARFAVLQLWKGLEAQKSFLINLKQDSSNFVKFFAYQVSRRNEETSNPHRFQIALTEESATWRVSAELAQYVLYRVAGHIPTSPHMLGAVLRMEALSPIIDQYETFVRLATHSLVGGDRFAPAFRRALSELNGVTADARIRKLLFLAYPDHVHLADLPFVDSVLSDQMLVGNYSYAATWGDRQQQDVDQMLLSARACAETGLELPRDTSFSNKLALLAERVVAKNQEDEAAVEAARLGLNLRFTSFMSSFAEFVNSQVSDIPLPTRQHVLTAFVDSPKLDLSALSALDDIAKSALSSLIPNPHSLTFADQFFRANMSEVPPAGLSRDAELKARAARALLIGDSDSALRIARELRSSTSPTTVREALRLEATQLLRLGDIDNAIETVVNGYLADKKSARMLPINTCVAALDRQMRSRLAGRLSTPIIFDLFTRLISDSLISQRRYTYDDFLTANGLNRPSDLRSCLAKYDRRQVVYYLRYICVPEVMEISISFDTSQQVEDERLLVCRLLIEADPENANDYESEIREITKKQLIQVGVRQVEQSKVSIDLEPVRRWAERNLKDSFTRYQSLLSVGIEIQGDVEVTNSDTMLDDSVESPRLADSVENRAVLSQDLPDVPTNEAATLLVNMIQLLLKICYIDPFHGLDCYLSMRIRHGALSGQLRAPLEEEKVITQRESGTDEYFANAYWIGRLGAVGPIVVQKIDDRLRRFSRDYDAMINEFARNKIQIRSTDKPDGAFAATVPPQSILLLAHEIHLETTFDSFVDLCFALFWESVDESLRGLREHIDHVLRPMLQNMFISLMTDMETITSARATPELNSAIRTAQTRAYQSLDQVKDWFRQAKPLPPKYFTFKEIVEIGLQQVRKIYHEFDPRLKLDADQTPPFGNLSRFSDIFFILFANIWKHSGTGNRPEVRVSASVRGKILRIEVANEVAPESITQETKTRVDEIKAIIERGAYHRAVRSEGGTGLIKLRNIVPRDEGGVEFGFTHNNTFNVRIDMPITFLELGRHADEDPDR
jgi:hypothetical protein